MLEPAEQLEHLKMAVQVAGVQVSDIVLPEDRDLKVGNLRLHYLDWGNKDGPPLVFLHGGALTAHTWDVVCLALRDQYHCLALDARGHGDSDWADDYSHERHCEDITGFIEQLGIVRTVMVGQSMGGLNSIVYAGRGGQRLSGLVIVDVGPELNLGGTQRIGDFIRDTPEAESIDAFIEKAMEFNPRRDPVLLRRSLHHNLRQLPNGKWSWKWDPNRMRSGMSKIEDHIEGMRKLWTQVEKIDCPALVMRGGKSDVFSDANAEKLAANLRKGRWVRIDNAGHTVQGDNPRDMVAALREFFGEIPF
ncbi:MAG TPA: alpha/beta hydrolase [Candidatus Binataceae bacterium]|nr:alpha/beta hydrolase [Candidatus Binataceae bacterium]